VGQTNVSKVLYRAVYGIWLYGGQTNISKLLYRAVYGCMWDREIFQNFYIRPYVAVCGTEKYFKTSI